MRVIPHQNGVDVTGNSADAVARWSAKLAKMRKQVGRVTTDPGKRPPQFEGRGLPRRKHIYAAIVDEDVRADFIAEAQHRGLACGALLGKLVEDFVEGLE